MSVLPHADIANSARRGTEFAVARKFHCASATDPTLCKCGTEFCAIFMRVKAMPYNPELDRDPMHTEDYHNGDDR